MLSVNCRCDGMGSVRAYPGKSRDGPVQCSGEAFSTRFTTQNGQISDLGRRNDGDFGRFRSRLE